jgi:hypothetical protein
VLRNSRSGGTPYCFGDGLGTSCPCGNDSAPGSASGCLHSASTGIGGTLRAVGSARLGTDSLVLTGDAMPNSSVLYFQGTLTAGAGAGVVFGDGLRCVAGSVTRLATLMNSGGQSAYPGPSHLPVSVRGLVTTTGTRFYQAWYRNAATFCTTSTFNLTNGLRVVWNP